MTQKSQNSFWGGIYIFAGMVSFIAIVIIFHYYAHHAQPKLDAKPAPNTVAPAQMTAQQKLNALRKKKHGLVLNYCAEFAENNTDAALESCVRAQCGDPTSGTYNC